MDVEIVKRWTVLTAGREQQGRPLASFDGLIAATALHHGLTLATRDINDFHGLGITLINPWDARALNPQRPKAKDAEPAYPPHDGEDDLKC